jgi:hypothetical protein
VSVGEEIQAMPRAGRYTEVLPLLGNETSRFVPGGSLGNCAMGVSQKTGIFLVLPKVPKDFVEFATSDFPVSKPKQFCYVREVS